jgi:membrane protein YdbS with pleckstrin-like domain
MATTQNGSLGAANLATTVSTTELTAGPSAEPPPRPDSLYPEGIPDPRGIQPIEEQVGGQGENTDPTAGTGVEGEVVVWEASYSKRNFIGRGLTRLGLTIAWIAMASYTWGMGHERLAYATWLVGAVVAAFWIALVFRMLQAQYSHFYRLTNRRLFVSTGLIHRRRDMMELMRIKEVFTRQQSLLERWLGLGTVVVVPSDNQIPTFYLTGVDDPQEVMDLIWHQARSERDQRSLKVEGV